MFDMLESQAKYFLLETVGNLDQDQTDIWNKMMIIGLYWLLHYKREILQFSSWYYKIL